MLLAPEQEIDLNTIPRSPPQQLIFIVHIDWPKKPWILFDQIQLFHFQHISTCSSKLSRSPMVEQTSCCIIAQEGAGAFCPLWSKGSQVWQWEWTGNDIHNREQNSCLWWWTFTSIFPVLWDLFKYGPSAWPYAVCTLGLPCKVLGLNSKLTWTEFCWFVCSRSIPDSPACFGPRPMPLCSSNLYFIPILLLGDDFISI